MGYWGQDEEGNSLIIGSSMVWGDQPADIMGDALDEIIAVFLKDVGRKPTIEELVGGLKFSAFAALEGIEIE